MFVFMCSYACENKAEEYVAKSDLTKEMKKKKKKKKKRKKKRKGDREGIRDKRVRALEEIFLKCPPSPYGRVGPGQEAHLILSRLRGKGVSLVTWASMSCSAFPFL